MTKKIFILFILMTLLISPLKGYGAPSGFEGGVNNEYLYEEMVFVTGKPMRFSGELKISESGRGDTKTITYKYNLTNKDEAIKTKLSRTVSFVIEYIERDDKGQATAQTTLRRYSEKIDIDKDKYVLEDFQFSKSDVIDRRPASDFYSGNLEGRKFYTLNRDEGEIIVAISGGNVGYENFWGSTETQIINYHIVSKQIVTDEEGESEQVFWEGSVQAQVSDSLTKKLVYSQNEPYFSSFDGGYIRTTNREMFSQYEYDLPRIRDGASNDRRRLRDKMTLSAKMVPKVERLVVPKFRDVRGHWAEEYITKLYSLDVFDESPNFFTPEVPMTRVEFTKGVIRACDIRSSMEDDKKKKTSRRNEPPEESPFKDVNVEDADYQYIKQGLEKSIITGISSDLFKPSDSLTRAQAITILIRALGFANRAPNPGYYTSFSDDARIPFWAKDSIYVAQEIGILQGDSNNRANPEKIMTRAEASAMLVRFLEFLERDLQRDYRENIILY